MSSQIVNYRVDDGTVVQFEIDPPNGFRSAGAGDISGRVRDAVGPAIEAAEVVLEKIKETRPDEVELKFGVKVSGGANWLVARAVAEGNFEIKLTWRLSDRHPVGPDSGIAMAEVPKPSTSEENRDLAQTNTA